MSGSLGVMLLTTAENWRGSGTSYAKLARGLAERGHRRNLRLAAWMSMVRRLQIVIRYNRVGRRRARGPRSIKTNTCGIAELCSSIERGRALAAAARKRPIEVFRLARMIDAYEEMMHTLVGKAAGPE